VNLITIFTFQMSKKNGVILILYIDDLLVIRNHIVEIKRLKRQLENVFKMSCLGLLNMHLGVDFTHVGNCIFMNYKHYVMVVF